MPEISVIVPVYKVEPFIRRCIDSILEQTFTDYELILVDDGSPDKCGEICDEYAAKDSRIHVIHQANGGLSAARNAGLDWVFANSDSRFISFIDSDDWVHPRFLELLREGITRFQVNICQCGYIETDGTQPAPDVSDTMFCITPDEQFIHHYSVYMCNKLFIRSCWQNTRFPNGQLYEDLAIWYKFLFSQHKLGFVDEVLYYYYKNPESIVRTDWTVRHFSRIRAWDTIIDYLTDYNNNAVLENAVYRYCHIAKRHYDEISRSGSVNAYTKSLYKARVKYRMRRMLVKYKHEMKSNGTYDYFFNWTYPLLGWIHWTCRGIAEKIKKS